MIDQVTIDRIIDAARIEEVIGEFVTLRKRGINYVGLCPFHDEKTPSFTVSPSKGICKCFSCGKGGNVVHFIMEHEQLSYYDALKWLAKKYNIEIVEKELTVAEQKVQNDRESLFILNEFAKDYYIRTLHEHAEGKSLGLGYFRERGFREDIIRKFQLGFSLGQKDAFTREAIAKGYKKEFLLKSGLSLENERGELHDRYRARVMFPVQTLSGKIVAFGGRILKKDEKTAKYINSPESEIYHKSNELYGIYFAKQAIAKADRCFLVEGYTDVLSMHQAGIENVVASSGTALTHGQIRMIHRFTNNVTVLYDGDAAGIKASLKGINLLLEEGLNIRVLLLPDGDDPDSFAKKHSASEFSEYIKEHETDFIRFKTEILLKDAGDDPVGRAHLIQDVVESIALIADDITRTVYITECSKQLEISEQLLQKEVDKKRLSVARDGSSAYRSGRQQYGVPRFSPGHSLPPQAPWPDQDHGSVPPANFIPDAPPSSPDDYQSFNPDQFPSVEPIDKVSNLENQVNSKMKRLEGNLIRNIIRYGNLPLFKKETIDAGLPAMTVTEFISHELKAESITLENPLYRQILEEAEANIGNKEFKPERHFLNHPDPQISLIAAEMITNPYELSKIYARFQVVVDESDQLDELIPHVVLELKNGILQQIILDIKKKLKVASDTSDDKQVRELSSNLMELQEVKKDIAKHLGERIVVRL
ncbi:MAG: DNA primase [Bacteroidota bacterium]|nr:DNA primase [Bacteroidota bacterium]